MQKNYNRTYDIWIHCGEDYIHLSFKGKLFFGHSHLFTLDKAFLWLQYSVMKSGFL